MSAVYVYGAGGMGRELLAHRRAAGLAVDAFVDRAAPALKSVDAVPVITPDELPVDPDSAILVALHSPGVRVAGVVDDLARRGFADVATLWTICRRDGWKPASGFWLEPDFAWDAARDAIEQGRRLMGDARSQTIYDEQIRLRRDGAYAGLSLPTPGDQYLPADLPRWDAPVRLVDCGAYDGDTLRAFEAQGLAIESAIALEPDPANFERLVASIGDRPSIRAVRAGVHARSGTIAFAANGAGSAHVDPDGTTTIDVVAIDALCSDFAPTLVKMDIEGAERDALDGARATLARDRPALAISVYHRVDDLWQIPLWIDGLGLGYRFDLRSHAHNGFDTVLYARVAP